MIDKTDSGTDASGVAESYRPTSYPVRMETLRELDPHFAKTWSEHAGRLLRRPQLDRRKRLLVLAGQYTMRGDLDDLRETVTVAINSRVNEREVLEAILQCYVYAGQSRVADAAEVFYAAASELGVLERVRETQPSLDRTTAGRSLADEREQWAQSDADDPRLEGFLERYGWYGISTGLRLRPGHHINLVATLDALDSDFLQIWLDSMYMNLYSRRVLDDATRLLCVVGDCLAVGETHQSRRHMRGALRQGVQPRELLEVIFQSCAIVGHPNMLPLAVDDLVTIADEEGLLGDLVDQRHIADLRRIVAARVARRDGVQDIGLGPAQS